MSFYIGKYLIQQDTLDLKHDSDNWSLPSTTAQHAGQTSNIEELLIKPEDMTYIPTQVQFGLAEWTNDEGFTPDHEAFKEFYVRDEAFYVRGFTPTDHWAEFYVKDEAFYVRGFTPVDFWSEFYVKDEAFYVRGFAPTDYWSEFYVKEEAFYVRNFTPTDSWTEFYVT